MLIRLDVESTLFQCYVPAGMPSKPSFLICSIFLIIKSLTRNICIIFSRKDRIICIFAVSKRLFDGARGGTKLERRQSVAVMQRTHKTPKKSKSKYVLKSPGRGE